MYTTHGARLSTLVLLAGLGCNHPPVGLVPTGIEVFHAPPLLGLPHHPLNDTIIVRTVDSETAKARPGVLVTWLVARGNGTVTPLDTVSDLNGLARAQWTIGSAGTNALQARTLEGASVTMSLTATAFTADLLVATAETGCGLQSGTPWCWGAGYGTDPPGPSSPVRPGWTTTSPVALATPSPLVDLSLSTRSLCGLDAEGRTYCAQSSSTQLSQVSDLPPLWMLAATPDGNAHCGLTRADSTAWCFVPDSAPPAPVLGGETYLTIRLAQWDRAYEGCGTRRDSTVACWSTGSSTAGPSVTRAPVPLPGSPHLRDLTKGRGFACGRTAQSALYCWGSVMYPVQPYAPQLARPSAGPVGSFNDWVQVLPTLTQWFGFDHLTPPATLQPAPAGLEGLRLLDYAKGVLTCIRTIDHQVYCLDRIFTGSPVLSVSEYGPVSPQLSFPE